ncbi:MAG: chorismate mutase [Candidatus Aenigmatarchaeota archaeon]
MEKLRKKIDSIDYELAEVLGRRMKIVEEMAKYKKSRGIKLRHLKREEVVLKKFADNCGKKGIDPAFGKRLMKEIIKYSIKTQKNVINRKDKTCYSETE